MFLLLKSLSCNNVVGCTRKTLDQCLDCWRRNENEGFPVILSHVSESMMERNSRDDRPVSENGIVVAGARDGKVVTSVGNGSIVVRSTSVAESIHLLRERMEAAAAALDFEEATRLRDRINLMRGGATAEEAAAADGTGLARQRAGAMGLGTSQQRVEPPAGWRKPAKPDLHTHGTKRGR